MHEDSHVFAGTISAKIGASNVKVFISWSEPQSQAIAEAFYAFIGDVLQNVKPFLSSHDIDAGANWPDVLRTELKTTGFGVLCLTAENLHKPWILFEAGAISNALDKGIVCPYLYGVKATDLQWPLAQFNANVADPDDPSGTHKVVRSINNAMGAAGLATDALDRSFRRCWNEYQEALRKVPPPPEMKEKPHPTFDAQKALEEILAAVRRDLEPRARYSPSIERLEEASGGAMNALDRLDAQWEILFSGGPLGDYRVGSESEESRLAFARSIARATDLASGKRFRVIKHGGTLEVLRKGGGRDIPMARLTVSTTGPDYDAEYEFSQLLSARGGYIFVAVWVADAW